MHVISVNKKINTFEYKIKWKILKILNTVSYIADLWTNTDTTIIHEKKNQSLSIRSHSDVTTYNSINRFKVRIVFCFKIYSPSISHVFRIISKQNLNNILLNELYKIR